MFYICFIYIPIYFIHCFLVWQTRVTRLICFTWGKAAYNKLYKDIQAETTTENRSYKEWVLRQKTLNSPCVKDLQDYLLACDGPLKKVYFAGTTTVRKLAPPS